MMLIGEFPVTQGNAYFDLLREKKIVCEARDIWREELRGIKNPHSRMIPYTRLFVDECNYEKAIQTIDDYERKSAVRARAHSKEVIRIMLLLLISVSVVIAVFFLVGNLGR